MRTMATFYSGSDDQGDIMQTLYIRESGNSSYPESSVNGSMPYISYSSSGPYSEILAGNSGLSQQTCLEFPVSAVKNHSALGGPDIAASQIMEQTYNAWRDGKDEILVQGGGSLNSVEDVQMGVYKQLSDLRNQNSSLQPSNVTASPGQGLSLSLGTHIAVPSFPCQSANSDASHMSSHQSASVNSGSCRDDNARNKLMHANLSRGLSTLVSTIPNSKYLKAVQQLLDEVVHIKNVLKNKENKGQALNNSLDTSSCKENDAGSKSNGMPNGNQESLVNSTMEPGHPERQELQNKITKLLAMLDEVDRRYRQYIYQMQTVVSSFDVIAGVGAAKTYTALALRTISRHFRCLRDAICGQIRSSRKSLGEEDNSSGKGGGIPRLHLIDQQLRQQRTMQQLGMMQPHAWRPQRGLPENSVSILRVWLFEHFLHPYPNDSDKLMLARQTGLARSQVSNWFINARVRLWKPMIEEMYKEETGDTEMDSNSSSDNLSVGKNDLRSFEDKEDLHSPDADIGRTATRCYHKPNVDEAYANCKLSDHRAIQEDSGLLQDAFSHSDVSERFMAYQMADLESYRNGGVSLTLGLQHCNTSIGSNSQHNFLPIQDENIYTTAPQGAEAADYDCVNPLDPPQTFGSSLRNLHDFVA
ncbi:Transcription factor MEIS1 and related HOX domain proteins protein [Dioscorea alata]|nr:Transcription factor MEIS1 and related HOX domain proteins protein [Dioscorea alata]